MTRERVSSGLIARASIDPSSTLAAAAATWRLTAMKMTSEMAAHHQEAADDDGAVEAEHAVREQPAEQRQKVHAGRVSAVHAPDVRHVEVQRLVHVQRQNRDHRVEAVSLPELGEEQHVQPR